MDLDCIGQVHVDVGVILRRHTKLHRWFYHRPFPCIGRGGDRHGRRQCFEVRGLGFGGILKLGIEQGKGFLQSFLIAESSLKLN